MVYLSENNIFRICGNLKWNPFSSTVFEPQPFLGWVSRENVFEHGSKQILKFH